MKKIIAAGIMMTAFAIGQPHESWQQIREFRDRGNTIRIFKFQDGANDCYVATMYLSETGAGISCLKR